MRGRRAIRRIPAPRIRSSRPQDARAALPAAAPRAAWFFRRVDDLGRIIIPKEIRCTLRIREGDPLELFLDRDSICLQKYSALGILSDDDLRIAHTMANRSNLHPIAIYDTTVKLSGGKKFPLYVPCAWESDKQMFICDEPYGVYKISDIDGIAGYVVCESSDIGCEMEMIARYLDAVIAN